MDPVIAAVLDHLRISRSLYRKALEDLSLEELHRRAGPDSSPLLWIAGHLASSRCGMLRMAGGSIEFPWPDLFSRGSRVLSPDRYPLLSEVVEIWDRVSAELEERLPALQPPTLDAPAPRKFPVEDPSLRGALAFLTYHEAYHIGQMGFARKLLGRDSLVG